MWRVCLCLVLLACSKSKSAEVKKDAAIVAPEREEKMSDKSAADIMADKVAKAKEEAAAQTPPTPPPPPTPEVAPTPAPPPTPAPDELPTEEPVADDSGSDAAPVFKIGECVMAKWDNAKWYPGRIVGIKDGKYDVDYDDGDKSRGLVPHRVRKMDAPKAPAK